MFGPHTLKNIIFSPREILKNKNEKKMVFEILLIGKFGPYHIFCESYIFSPPLLVNYKYGPCDFESYNKTDPFNYLNQQKPNPIPKV